MEIKRFFVSKSALTQNCFTIDNEEFIHLTKVLRHKVGYKIVVCCNDEFDYNCTITKIENSYCIAKIDSKTENDCLCCADITLFQAMPKGDKIDLITQKMVELGVVAIQPFLSQFTNEDKCNIARLNKISIEACKQCGRSKICNVLEMVNYDEIIAQFGNFDAVILPYENAEIGKIGEINNLKNAKKIAVVVGSEGGFCQEEIDKAKQNGAQIVSLGNRILRCETAAIVTIALVNYELGEMSK